MDKTLRDILRDKQQAVFSVAPDATVLDAVKVMVEGGAGCVLIIDKGRVQGLFTERDLMRRVVSPQLDEADTRIDAVMTSDVAIVSPKMTVHEAMSFCTEKRLRHLPVFDGETLLGVVSAGDLTKTAVADQQHTIDDLIRYVSG